jgi:hypothetical protein
MSIHCACKLMGKPGRGLDAPFLGFDTEVLGRAMGEAGELLQRDFAEVRKEGLNASLVAWRNSVVI